MKSMLDYADAAEEVGHYLGAPPPHPSTISRWTRGLRIGDRVHVLRRVMVGRRCYVDRAELRRFLREIQPEPVS